MIALKRYVIHNIKRQPPSKSHVHMAGQHAAKQKMVPSPARTHLDHVTISRAFEFYLFFGFFSQLRTACERFSRWVASLRSGWDRGRGANVDRLWPPNGKINRCERAMSKLRLTEKRGFECRNCGCQDTRVYHTDSRRKMVIRHRKCRNCGQTYTTIERMVGRQ